MIVIRGATTIDEDIPEEIINAVSELLKTIISKNNLNKSDIKAMFFSATKDIRSEYPAKAARLMGFTDIALMCFQEMDVEGSLSNCIRVSLFYDNTLTNEALHVYLRKAACLRPDLAAKGANN